MVKKERKKGNERYFTINAVGQRMLLEVKLHCRTGRFISSISDTAAVIET